MTTKHNNKYTVDHRDSCSMRYINVPHTWETNVRVGIATLYDCLVPTLSPRTVYKGIRQRPRKWRLGCSSLCPRSPCVRHRPDQSRGLDWSAHRSVHIPGYSVHLLMQPENTICCVYMPNTFHCMHMCCNVGIIYTTNVYTCFIVWHLTVYSVCWHDICSVAYIFSSVYFFSAVSHLLCVSMFLLFFSH